MKIPDSNLNAVTTPSHQTGQAGGSGATGRATGSSRNEYADDRVQLSELSETLKALGADGPEREARVTRLAAEYRAGRYQPDAQAASRAIIDDASSER
jgi:anti-sigma28 factor (negative regulator of flagellin synthesis)